MRDLHHLFNLIRNLIDSAEHHYEVGNYEGTAERFSEIRRAMREIWVELRKELKEED